MAVITFEQIARRLAEHQRAEAARNAPEAVARRAVHAFASAFAELDAAERFAVFDLLMSEVGAAISTPAPIVA